jgi:hypothetical protein
MRKTTQQGGSEGRELRPQGPAMGACGCCASSHACMLSSHGGSHPALSLTGTLPTCLDMWPATCPTWLWMRAGMSNVEVYCRLGCSGVVNVLADTAEI